MNYPKLCAYLALFLIGAIIFIVMQCQAGRDTDLSKNAEISKLREKDKLNQEVQTRQDSVISSERHARATEHKSRQKEDSTFHMERTAIQRTLKQLLAIRQASGVRIDTITMAVEGQYQAGAMADSVQIQKLEARILADSASFETEIKGWVTKFDSQVAVTEGWRLQAVESTKDATKYKRQRNKARLAAGVLGAVVALWIVDKVKD